MVNNWHIHDLVQVFPNVENDGYDTEAPDKENTQILNSSSKSNKTNKKTRHISITLYVSMHQRELKKKDYNYDAKLYKKKWKNRHKQAENGKTFYIK